MLDATLHALIKELIRQGAIDAKAMHESLMADGELEAAGFVGACLIEVDAEDLPQKPAPRPHLAIVPDPHR
ncbi:MAG: hypothetical protein V4530_06115 [Pseudomonadota bacterium]